MNDLPDVPGELKEQEHWVNWTLFRKADGQVAKIPIDPKTGGYASVNDSSTWGSFDVAIQRTRTDHRVNGIGFVFIAGDPLAGVDFDHCRSPETGEIDPLALAQMTSLDSYAEASVSGQGVHVIVKAVLSEHGCRRGNVEFYDRGRFFVVTGNRIPGSPTTINPRQAEVDVLHRQIFPPTATRSLPISRLGNRDLNDDTLIARILHSLQGEKFKYLLAGAWSNYPSQSEADLALCGILSFWTQSAVQIDRIFRSSALYREKWDETHSQNGLTYGEMTIKKALGITR